MTKEEIIEVVADLYEEYSISEFGFSLIDYCDKAEISLIPYSSYGNKANAFFKIDNDGFNMINPATNKCEIYYNDKVKPLLRIKFTIPHEIGHISLGHNLLNCDETPKQRTEANIFANEFYCPQVFLIHYNLQTKKQLMSTFKITAKYADTLLDILSKRRNTKYSPAEERLLKIFLRNRKNK